MPVTQLADCCTNIQREVHQCVRAFCVCVCAYEQVREKERLTVTGRIFNKALPESIVEPQRDVRHANATANYATV